MAGTMEMSAECRRAELDGSSSLFNTGYLRLYAGTRPAHPEDALGGATLLAELRFSATAWQAAASATANEAKRTANAITSDASADATGTAAFWRAFKSNGTTVIAQGDVGTGTGSINLNSVAIQAGASVAITSITDELPE